MQYVRSISGSVSKTWNSINPATLSGAIDVIVVKHQDESLSCSPFHVRFGKFSLLRPSDKKVEFSVNGVKQDYFMKLGEGGEAFFVFETTDDIPLSQQTSPLVSPTSSPTSSPRGSSTLQEPEFLDLTASSAESSPPVLGQSLHDKDSDFILNKQASDGALHTTASAIAEPDALYRANALSKKLSVSNIPSHVTESGDIMLEASSYKNNDEEALHAELIARKILAEELQGHHDIGAFIGTDPDGNIWIYGSEKSKLEHRRANTSLALVGDDLSADASNQGYISDLDHNSIIRASSDDLVSEPQPIDQSPPQTSQGPQESDAEDVNSEDSTRNYAKTLRLTNQQLQALNLQPGPNEMTFTVNKATCTAYMYLWDHKTPILISDIDGTITKSDALGHVLNMIGRDWTHLGVAKLYSDIVSNGYNVVYLTSRSTGQADTTRTYLNGVLQDGYRLPKGPVLMSPDRTMAALRREIYLRKPEAFKMACLRDILSLFPPNENPFYAGFGNRITDALSYRYVNIPSSRIFTINSNAEVQMDLLSLNKYKSSYVSMRELVDQFFPPVGTLVPQGAEEFTDFTYWRDKHVGLEDFHPTDSESESVSDEDEDEDEDGVYEEEDEYPREDVQWSQSGDEDYDPEMEGYEFDERDEEEDGDNESSRSLSSVAEEDEISELEQEANVPFQAAEQAINNSIKESPPSSSTSHARDPDENTPIATSDDSHASENGKRKDQDLASPQNPDSSSHSA